MNNPAGSEGMDFETFSNKMVEICNKHKQADKALAFGFILCDFDNPQIWKILNDREYWLALNEISGKYLSLFSLNYNPPVQEKHRDIYELSYLTNISINQNPRIATNTLIQKYFKETEVNYPAILFFQVDNSSVIDSLLIDLKEQEIEKAFLELKNYIIRSVSALRKIAPENRQNVREIFNCLETEIKSLRTARTIKRIAQNIISIKELLSSIKVIL
jgi:hypothetical protein